MPDKVERPGLDRLRREPAAEIGDGIEEIDIGLAAQIGRRRAGSRCSRRKRASACKGATT